MPTLGQQSFITVNADGTIEYTFDGRIVARGIDLTAQNTILGVPPEPLNTIEWLEPTTGVPVTQETSYTNVGSGNAGSHIIRTQDPHDDFGGSGPANSAELRLQVDNAGGLSRINLAVTNGTGNVVRQSQFPKLIDNLGDSDFAYLPTVSYGAAAPLGGYGGAAPLINFSLPRANMEVIFAVSMSGYAAGVGIADGRCSLDGALQQTSNFYFNAAGVHQTLPTLTWTRNNLAAGVHTLQPFAGFNLVRDANDYAQVSIIAL